LGTGYIYTFNTELRDSGGNQPPVADNDSGVKIMDILTLYHSLFE